VAGLFQFVQTQMMRPANQPKSTDPQQAMMNSVMNIMPLTVVFFGWELRAGPVLYWATQSVYSVVQQWFITGWGNFIKWATVSCPSCRSTGVWATGPPRDLGLGGRRQWRWSSQVLAPGPMGWLQRKMEDAQKQALERSGGQPASDGKNANGAGKRTPLRQAQPRLPGRLEMVPPAPGPGTASGKAARALHPPPPAAAPVPRAATMAPR
jgi:hypothetical protein